MHVTKAANEIETRLKLFHNYCINLNLEEKTIRSLMMYTNNLFDFLKNEDVTSLFNFATPLNLITF